MSAVVAFSAPPVLPGATQGASAVAQVEVTTDLAVALPVWAELEAVCAASIYQTRRWLVPWIETVGKSEGVEPFFIIGRDLTGIAVAFLPLGLSQKGPLRAASFLGGKDSNFNLGLFRDGALPDTAAALAFLRAGVAAAPRRADLLVLTNQPETWEGLPNRLRLPGGQASPSAGWKCALAGDAAAFVQAKLSKDARKKLRQKRANLEKLGAVRHFVARGGPETQPILEAFFVQKVARLREMGVDAGFESEAARLLMSRLATPQEACGPAVEFHALTVDGRVVATYAGALHRGRFHGMVNSYDLDPAIARCSPGDLLLLALVEHYCAAGVAVLDLGIGEGRYKNTWCDVAEPLFDVMLPVSMLGSVAAAVERGRLSAKRVIKQNPKLWEMAKRARGWIG